MVVDLQRAESYARSRNGRAVVQGIGALLLFAFGSFWVLFGLASVFLLPQPKYPVLNGVLFIVIGGLFPAAAGALLAVWSLLNARRSSHMRRLVAVVTSGAVRGTDRLACAMDVSPAQAHRLAYDALACGLLDRESFAALTSNAATPGAGMERDPGVARRAPRVAPAPAIGVGALREEPGRQRQGPPQGAIAMQASAWPGRTLKGTWQVEGMIGAGGMGAVFRTRHLRTGRTYALKVILPGFGQSREVLQRFEREATAASSLGHRGIIAVHDFDWTEEGAAYLVMDLLDGETLLQRLERRGALEWRLARPIALELCDALAAAHGLGLLHRDVKPANVFLARDAGGERAVLLDFGVVKRMNASPVSRITSTGVVVGTPLYMSPEQARGAPLDARSDLYCLAVLIYEMVTGLPPFFDRSEAEVYARLMREKAPLASSVAPGACPRELDEVLSRALAQSPAARPADVRAFLAELARVR